MHGELKESLHGMAHYFAAVLVVEANPSMLAHAQLCWVDAVSRHKN